MEIKQISVFLENTPNSLAKLTETLAQNKINIRALSLADSTDFGIARMIVDNPAATKETLKTNDFVVNITPVLLVKIPDVTGSLNTILALLSKNGRNVEYMYGFTGKKSNSAYMILRCTDNVKTESILKDAGIHLVSAEELDEI